ncbi:MAG: response regulator [Aquimonas sp.]|nr:response regulator [Aquimonas sp.]
MISSTNSTSTSILLWRLVPQALAIPSQTQLQLANSELHSTIAARDEALRQLTLEIAQRERAEGALVQAQKMDAIGQLTGGIAHDFNNLLQAVGGNLELIRSQPANGERVARWAERASEGLARGIKLTSQLLTFSRTQRLELRPVELNGLIAGMQELIASSVGAKVALQIELQPDLCPVTGDATQLELAILNMAINARDAMPSGGKLTIATRAITLTQDEITGLPSGDYVELSVADTGSGMPPEVLARAMDPFFTTKQIGSGTGLGLSMAFGVATQSGGTLQLRSKVGEGTRVIFILPCTLAGEDISSSDQAAGSSLYDELAGLHVAVVDDDERIRDFLTESLGQYGIECTVFDSGDRFVASTPPTKADVVVLDYAMPGLSGAEVARHLKQADPDLPVIIMTGYADSAALDAILGEVHVIRKPFRVDDLLAAIMHVRKE